MQYSLSRFKSYFILLGLLIVLLLSLVMINKDTIHHDTQEIDSNMQTDNDKSKIKAIASHEDVQPRLVPSVDPVIRDTQKEESPDRGEGREPEGLSSEVNFKLVGTIIESGKGSYAIIVDEDTGERGNYRVGDTISAFKVLKLDRDRVVIEREGSIQVLVFKGSNYDEAFHDISSDVQKGVIIEGSEQTLTQFEAVAVEEGPPRDGNLPVKDLPYFKPITNDTGPPMNPKQVYRDLPEFIPIESDSGPPG